MQPIRTGLLLVAGLLAWPGCLHAQYVAFWDHVPGTNQTQTHPNTTIGVRPMGLFLQFEYPLKNISNGLLTPAVLIITNSSLGSGAFVTCPREAGNPAPGTPLYQTFYYPTNVGGPTNYSYVFFGACTNSASLEFNNAAVTCIFRGLNPHARYSFKAGAVRGGTTPEMATRWTRVEITGADWFVPRMSSNILTHAHTSDLAPNQVAVNFAGNQTPETGDMVAWEDIAPGYDGAFSVICTHYTGTVPGGSSDGTRAYAFTGIRFEETLHPALTLTNQPNGNLTISWRPAGGVVQESTNLSSWANTTLTNGASLRPTNHHRFYRLRQ